MIDMEAKFHSEFCVMGHPIHLRTRYCISKAKYSDVFWLWLPMRISDEICRVCWLSSTFFHCKNNLSLGYYYIITSKENPGSSFCLKSGNGLWRFMWCHIYGLYRIMGYRQPFGQLSSKARTVILLRMYSIQQGITYSDIHSIGVIFVRIPNQKTSGCTG